MAKKVPVWQKRLAEHLIEIVRFEQASLTLTAEQKEKLLACNCYDTEAVTATIREITRSYVETWVVPTLANLRDGNMRQITAELDRRRTRTSRP